MGNSCGCGGETKDQEIDLYMSKHHRAYIATEKDNFEVAALDYPKEQRHFEGKLLEEEMRIVDEVAKALEAREKEEDFEFDMDMMLASMDLMAGN